MHRNAFPISESGNGLCWIFRLWPNSQILPPSHLLRLINYPNKTALKHPFGESVNADKRFLQSNPRVDVCSFLYCRWLQIAQFRIKCADRHLHYSIHPDSETQLDDRAVKSTDYRWQNCISSFRAKYKHIRSIRDKGVDVKTCAVCYCL